MSDQISVKGWCFGCEEENQARSKLIALWRSSTKNSRRASRRIPDLLALNCSLVIVLRRFHAAEAEMIGTGVDLPFAARADNVAGTILSVAKKRAAPMHPLLLAGLGRIER